FVPPECMYRPKMGFRVPVARLMREQAHNATRTILLSERFLDRRLIRRPFVEEMLEEHRTRQQEHGTRLWALVMLELWFRTWIDSDSNQPLGDNDNPFAAYRSGSPAASPGGAVPDGRLSDAIAERPPG